MFLVHLGPPGQKHLTSQFQHTYLHSLLPLFLAKSGDQFEVYFTWPHSPSEAAWDRDLTPTPPGLLAIMLEEGAPDLAAGTCGDPAPSTPGAALAKATICPGESLKLALVAPPVHLVGCTRN